jgi:hypothetical protein
MSFRAYGETENRFVRVVDTEYRHIGDTVEGREPWVSLEARTLPRSPFASEFWFIAWAEIPPLSPPKMTVRLFAFDGENFRTVWTTDDFTAPDFTLAVPITQDSGFSMSRMPDPRGNRVLVAQYALTADGRVSENETEHR